MEYVWALVFLSGVGFCVGAFYEDISYRRERKLEMNKRFYPLNFETASGFHILKDTTEQKEEYGIFNTRNFLVYKIIKKSSRRRLIKEEWSLINANDRNEMVIICVGSLLHKHYVQFPLINRYSSLAIHGSPVGPNPSPILQTLQQNSAEEDVVSSRLESSLSEPPPYFYRPTPYIDSSLAENQYFNREDLGDLVTFRINEDLQRFEARKLSKIYLRPKNTSRSSTFKVSKNSMLYSWRPNGYLEKQSKDLLDNSIERIGMIRFQNRSGTDYWIYINNERIDPLIAISSAFLHHKLSLWKTKKLSTN